jgi:uncharacterized membrane protein
MNKRTFITAALAAAVASPMLLSAQKPVPAPSWKKINSDPKAWIYVPEGYCERIVGGSKTPK